MKNKFLKILTCIIFALLISLYTPQNYTVSLITNPIHKNVIVPFQDPPFV